MEFDAEHVEINQLPRKEFILTFHKLVELVDHDHISALEVLSSDTKPFRVDTET